MSESLKRRLFEASILVGPPLALTACFFANMLLNAYHFDDSTWGQRGNTVLALVLMLASFLSALSIIAWPFMAIPLARAMGKDAVEARRKAKRSVVQGGNDNPAHH